MQTLRLSAGSWLQWRGSAHCLFFRFLESENLDETSWPPKNVFVAAPYLSMFKLVYAICV
jgi:hypothetical protein